MDYKIVEKEAFMILEKAETHTTVNNENLKSIPNFWTRSHNDGTLNKLLDITSDKTYFFGVCYGSTPGHTETFDYSIAVSCDKNTKIPEGFRKNTIPAGTWAIFECNGPMPDAMQNMWRRIVSEFFPASGYQPACEMDIEAYTPGDMGSSDYRSEIWIPIIKNRY